MGEKAGKALLVFDIKKNQYNAENFRETISAQKALSLTNY